MTKNFFATLMSVVLLGSVSATAANLRQDRILVQEAIAHAQNHRRPGDGELRRSEDKFLQVQRDIFDLRPSTDKMRLERSLDDALRALADMRLPVFQKVDTVVRSGNEALRAIDALDRSTNSGARVELTQTLVQLDRSLQLTRTLNFRQAQNEVRFAQTILSRHTRDIDLMSAVRELDRLALVLGDRYMDPRQIVRQAEYSVRIARDLILRSRTYNDVGDPNVPGDRDTLGQTRNFGARYATTEVITVGRYEGRFTKLAFRALGGDVRIDSIEIVYGNGRTEILHGGFIKESDVLRIDLRGQDRAIQSIRITAQSVSMGGRRLSEASLLVRGIR